MKVLSKKNVWFTVVVSCVIIALLSYVVINTMYNQDKIIKKDTSFLESFVATCSYPFLKIQSFLLEPLKKRISYHTLHDQLYKKALAIQDENDQLKAKIIELEVALHFAHKTEEVVQFSSRYTTNFKRLAKVLLRCFTEQEHSLIIDSGSLDGIVKDMAVVYKNNLIGKISHVYTYHSKVLLITDRRCPVSCYCVNTKTEGILQGDNSFNASHLLHVDRLHDLKVDDLVVSSGQGVIFPEGFALGKIDSFNPDGIHYSIQVKPIFLLHEIDYCYVIQKVLDPSEHEIQ